MKKILINLIACSLFATPAFAAGGAPKPDMPAKPSGPNSAQHEVKGLVLVKGDHNVFFGSTNIGNVRSNLVFVKPTLRLPLHKTTDATAQALSHSVFGASTGYENITIGVIGPAKKNKDFYALGVNPSPEIDVDVALKQKED